ncbi:hypothetical protein BMS3Bbin10_01394 [bacterium BMS3Bbin10]|nr:hypothetical protein BMS3Bbin10_01394 [bacterium BMS3Bbin10]
MAKQNSQNDDVKMANAASAALKIPSMAPSIKPRLRPTRRMNIEAGTVAMSVPST